MPVKIKDTDNGIGNIIELCGIVTDQEYVSALKGHLQQENRKFRKYRYCLFDTTEAKKLEISNESIELIAGLCAKASKVNPDPIVAFIAKSDLAYGLSRMYEAFIFELEWDTMVYRSKKEAVDWIKEKVSDNFGINDLLFS